MVPMALKKIFLIMKMSIFPNVKLETEFGKNIKTKSRVPFMTGALGSTFIAQKY